MGIKTRKRGATVGVYKLHSFFLFLKKKKKKLRARRLRKHQPRNRQGRQRDDRTGRHRDGGQLLVGHGRQGLAVEGHCGTLERGGRQRPLQRRAGDGQPRLRGKLK